MDRFDPFVKYADVYGDVINWEKDPMNKPQNQNKYFFSDGKTYYEQICKMLRLMSVFKEAFNQIYDNEDEIHSAWENFVDNLSATAVYGEEVGVNLTWTDTSVNFAFTIPGGEDGVGIQSITFNSDYTMTITLTDGQTYTSGSLRGPQGEQGIQGIQGPAGPQGEPGSGLEILDVYPTLQDLQTAHPTGSPGDAYQVGTAPNYTLYIWSASQSAWVPAGTIGSAVPSSADPLMDGTASAGISDLYSRGDHIHPTDTSRASAQDLQTVDNKVDAVDDRVDDLNDFINTSQKLIDQSFVYRESPAEHDGLAVLDKIKGHTVKFNQLIQDGNFTSASDWTNSSNESISASDNILTIEKIASNSQTLQTYKMINAISSHTYLVTADFKADNNETIIMRLGTLADNPQGSVSSSWTTIAGIKTIQNGGSTEFNFYVLNNESSPIGSKIYVKNVMCIDLSDIFGIGNEPAAVEAFKNWLSNNIGLLPYYAYTPGTLIPFKGTGLKTVGFNQWDEEWELGTFDSNGTEASTNDRIRSKNYIPCLAGETYYYKSPAYGYFFFYNSDKNSISMQTPKAPGSTITVPNGASYMRFRLDPSYGTTYNNDICINISDPEKNGTYEPYKESILSLEALNTLFPTGMKSAGSVYDEATESKAITRIGTREYQSGDESDTSVITDGITTYYALTTPIEQDIDLDLSFKAYKDGTEQLLPVNGATPTTSSLLADMTYFSINDAMDYILAKLDQVPSSITSDINSLKTRMTSAEGDITSLGGRMTAAEGNITSLAGRMTTAEGNITDNASRISTLENNLFKIEVKQFDYATVSAESSVGTTTTITVDEGYKALGIVGTDIQAGEFTSPVFNCAITQCHLEYTPTNALRITIGARNNSAVDKTNVRLYAYILCMKDYQSE